MARGGIWMDAGEEEERVMEEELWEGIWEDGEGREMGRGDLENGPVLARYALRYDSFSNVFISEMDICI